jgi:hypothetical protein
LGSSSKLVVPANSPTPATAVAGTAAQFGAGHVRTPGRIEHAIALDRSTAPTGPEYLVTDGNIVRNGEHYD